MTSMCTRSPTTGGKHARPSKFCEHHYQELDNTSNLTTPHCTDLLEKDRVGTLPKNDENVLVECRKAKGVNRFYDCTAGVMAIVRPCGIFNRNVHMRVTNTSLPLLGYDLCSSSRH